MSKHTVFAFVGGDRRQVYVMLGLARDGFEVRVAGLSAEELSGAENITVCGDPQRAISGADCIVLPVPYSSVLSAQNINTPLYDKEIRLGELFAVGQELDGKLILAGRADERLLAMARLGGARVVDYMEREELAVLNAIPTAEGAVKIAIEELPITLHGSNCLVTGFGRVGKVLCAALKGLGARVTAAVRKKSDLAYIKAFGYDGADIMQPIPEAEKFDVIFNTVPKLIIDEIFLSALRTDCLIIDLASKPGGVDFEAARRMGRSVIWALSLPGKTSPLTAGEIIRDTIKNIIDEQAR